MFRQMRRKNQELSKEETVEILNKCTNGTLALLTEEGYTYAVPLNYVYNDGKIYFHGAKEGLKTDAIKNHNKVSFAVVEKDTVVPKEYTTYFRSAVVFGTIEIMENKSEKTDVINMLVKKYSPDFVKYSQEEIGKLIDNVGIICLNVEKMTGKEAVELVKARQK